MNQPTGHSTTTANSTAGGSAGADAGEGVKNVVGQIHGAGEALRGNVNSFIDSVGGDKAAGQKDAAVANKGVNQMDTGKFNAHDLEPTTQDSGRHL